MDIIDIRQVSKRYSNHLALDRVSFSIPQGSVFGLLGPNGAGKTSLIRILTRITAPDSGEVFFNGHPLADTHMLDMGYLPEERGLYKKMQVGEQALYLARLKGLSRHDALQRLKYWFEKFEIQSWWDKKVEELSKGMAQKVQFITTVLHDPSFIILDEPFTGFDPINAELIKNELIGLKNQGVAIVLSTHRMESVEELCSHIALINRAKVILNGSVKDIRSEYRSHSYILDFTGDQGTFNQAVSSAGEVVSIHEVDGLNTAVVVLRQEVDTNKFLSLLLPVCQVISFNELIPGISDIFIKKVSEVTANTEIVS